MSIKVLWHNTEYGLGSDIRGEAGVIRVCRDRELFDGSHKLREPSINWSALGAQPIAVAEEYANLLSKAVVVARMMAGSVYMWKVSLEYQRDGEWHNHSISLLGNNKEQVLASICSSDEVPLRNIQATRMEEQK